MKAEGYLSGLKQNAGDTEVILYASAGTARAVGYNPFMPSYPHIEEYRAKLQELIEFGGSDNEENIRPAFQNCLDAYCHDHRERLVLIPELKTSPSNKPDGTVKDSLRMVRGYWEAKDSHDDLDAEIKVKFNRGYPRDNIIFEDSQTAVLVQNGSEAMRADMSRGGELHRLIHIFLDYELPEIQEFRQAQSQFKADLPTVLENLRATVADAEAENPGYQEASAAFLNLCRETIGPAVSAADVREMLLQHILTKDIFLRVFTEDQFHRENNVARQLDKLERTFFTDDVRRQAIDRLRAYYGVIGRAADEIADYAEKQQFLKAIYEDFYTAYNPAAADRLGVVYTPNEVVDFIIRGVDHLLRKHFGRTLADDNVQILDPATGTGTFVTNLINRFRHLGQARSSATCSVTRARTRGRVITWRFPRTLPPIRGTWQSGQLAVACSTLWVGSSLGRPKPWGRFRRSPLERAGRLALTQDGGFRSFPASGGGFCWPSNSAIRASRTWI